MLNTTGQSLLHEASTNAIRIHLIICWLGVKKMTLISFFICPIELCQVFLFIFSFERWNCAFEFNYNFNGCHKVLMGDLIQSLLNLSIKRSINSNINKGTTHLKVGCFYKQDVTKHSFCQAVKKLLISCEKATSVINSDSIISSSRRVYKYTIFFDMWKIWQKEQIDGISSLANDLY